MAAIRTCGKASRSRDTVSGPSGSSGVTVLLHFVTCWTARPLGAWGYLWGRARKFMPSDRGMLRKSGVAVVGEVAGERIWAISCYSTGVHYMDFGFDFNRKNGQLGGAWRAAGWSCRSRSSCRLSGFGVQGTGGVARGMVVEARRSWLVVVVGARVGFGLRCRGGTADWRWSSARWIG